MTSDLEAAATVDPSDPASVQTVADMARSSQHAATAIADYTSKVCGVTIGNADDRRCRSRRRTTAT